MKLTKPQLFLCLIAVVLFMYCASGCTSPAMRRVASTFEVGCGMTSSDGSISSPYRPDASTEGDGSFVVFSLRPLAALEMANESDGRMELVDRLYRSKFWSDEALPPPVESDEPVPTPEPLKEEAASRSTWPLIALILGVPLAIVCFGLIAHNIQTRRAVQLRIQECPS